MPTGGPFPGKCVGAEGCQRPIRVKKWMLCNSHYVNKMRHEESHGTCGLDWCDNKFYAKGLCQNHYQRWNQGLPISVPTPRPLCSFAGCDRETKTKGLCNSHYQQKWQGKELFPLKPKREVPERPGERLCKTCNEWRDREEGFYNSSGGTGKQSECKKCMGRRSRRSRLIKEGRLEEAELI